SCLYLFMSFPASTYSFYLSLHDALPISSSYDDYLISPMIDMSGGQKRLRFDYEVLDADVPMEIVVSSEGIGPDNFTTVVSPEEIDRKSTRLNSSHVSISYAVFCLKKKKP